MTKQFLVFIIAFSLIPISTFAVEFDELDKPPEGAHSGQMLLGAFFAIGKPYGSLVDAEDEFLEDTTYSFDNETTKLVEVSHLSFGFGLIFEYMPIDHLGLKTNLRRSIIIQRTNFGSEYENWRGTLYSDYSFYFGPTIHATTRRSWDFTLTPLVGYYYGSYNATPVAQKIIDDYDGKTKKTVSGLSYGVEFNFATYFSGGPFLTLGVEWLRNKLDLGSQYELANPHTSSSYYQGKTSGTIDAINFKLSTGYAFSN